MWAKWLWKTTLTRLVNGLIPYFYPGEVTGTTYVDGKDIQDYLIYEVSEYVGSVFQIHALNFLM